MKGSTRESLVTARIENPVALTYDWIHRNLYWADAGLHSDRARIEVLTLNNRWRRMLLDESVVRSPTVMVADPRSNQGYSIAVQFVFCLSIVIPLFIFYRPC